MCCVFSSCSISLTLPTLEKSKSLGMNPLKWFPTLKGNSKLVVLACLKMFSSKAARKHAFKNQEIPVHTCKSLFGKVCLTSHGL